MSADLGTCGPRRATQAPTHQSVPYAAGRPHPPGSGHGRPIETRASASTRPPHTAGMRNTQRGSSASGGLPRLDPWPGTRGGISQTSMWPSIGRDGSWPPCGLLSSKSSCALLIVGFLGQPVSKLVFMGTGYGRFRRGSLMASSRRGPSSPGGRACFAARQRAIRSVLRFVVAGGIRRTGWCAVA